MEPTEPTEPAEPTEPPEPTEPETVQGAVAGTYPEKTYANSIDKIPITAIRNTLCLMVNRNSLPSSAVVMPVAATPTALLRGETILPITPAAEFTEAISTGLR